MSSSHRYTFREFDKLLDAGHVRFTRGKEIVVATTPTKCAHHALVVEVPGQPAVTNYIISFPPLKTSHITKMIPQDSKFATYFTYADLYAKWPLGKNEGEDPQGEELVKFFQKIRVKYCEALQNDTETLNRICMATNQLKTDDDGKPIPLSNVGDKVASTINYPKYQEPHEKAGQRDFDKSPTIKVALWTAKLENGKPQGVKKPKSLKDSLLLQPYIEDPTGDERDPSRYRLFSYTKIENCMANPKFPEVILKESRLKRFQYCKGDSALGLGDPSTMMCDIEIVAPTFFWADGKDAVLKFKASYIGIHYQKYLTGNKGKTEQERIEKYNEMVRLRKAYGFGDDDDDYGGEKDFSNSRGNHVDGCDSHGASKSVNHSDEVGSDAGRKLNPDAVISVKTVPATNSVVVYHKKKTTKEGVSRLNGDSNTDVSNVFEFDDEPVREDKEKDEERKIVSSVEEEEEEEEEEKGEASSNRDSKKEKESSPRSDRGTKRKASSHVHEKGTKKAKKHHHK
jgi:hypothetical protein